MRRLASLAFALASLSLAASGCAPEPCPSTPAGLATTAAREARPAAAHPELTVLYTSDEHGWIAPKDDRYAHLGGASQLLGALLDRERHCPGELDRDGVSVHPRREHCPSRTLLLSGGDNFTGPAVSTHLRGRSVADTMRVLGYAASAFGNHELDFGREALLANRERSGVRYLAANMVREDGAANEFAEPFAVFERGGVRLGVVGLATESTLKSGMRQRFVGYRFEPVEATLDRVVPQVWAAGVDAVAVIAHECHDELAPTIARHPEWHLAFVGTGHCHRGAIVRAGETLLLAPAASLSHYARITLRIDPTRPARERAVVVDHGLVDLASPVEGPLASGDAGLDAAIAGWQRQVDVELGEPIGWAAGSSASSDAVVRWLLGSWLEAYPEADLALTTLGAIRQDLPPGPVSRATIASIFPFENELVVARVPQAELAALVQRVKSVVLGVSCAGGTCRRSDGAPLGDPVRVVTTDFLYYGGDGYELERFDRAPTITGADWRAPLLAWTRRIASTKDRPLEARLSELPPRVPAR